MPPPVATFGCFASIQSTKADQGIYVASKPIEDFEAYQQRLDDLTQTLIAQVDSAHAFGVGLLGSIFFGHQFLVQNPFMGSMLVDQIESFRTFGDDVHSADLANHAQGRQLAGRLGSSFLCRDR